MLLIGILQFGVDPNDPLSGGEESDTSTDSLA